MALPLRRKGACQNLDGKSDIVTIRWVKKTPQCVDLSLTKSLNLDGKSNHR